MASSNPKTSMKMPGHESKMNTDLYTEQNAHNQKSSDEDLTMFQMFCFGIAGFAFQIMASAIAVFSTKFLLDEANIKASYTTIIYLLSKTVDGITDPIYGHFVTQSKFTRFGKNKPW
jgi:Na+/melibiose symporter-like transporter